MPSPTRSQLMYGSATVVLSTFAILLLSEARSTGAVLIVAVAGLALGVLVAVVAATPLSARVGAKARQRPNVPVTAVTPRSRVSAATTVAEPREHSLQR